MRHLDKRLLKKSSGGSFKRKERVVSSPSLSEAPLHAPTWAVLNEQTLCQDDDESVCGSVPGLSAEHCDCSDYKIFLVNLFFL